MPAMRTMVLAVGLLVPMTEAVGGPDGPGTVELGAGWVRQVDGIDSHSVMLAYLTPQTHPWEFAAGYIAPRSSTEGPNTPAVKFAGAGRRFVWRGWFVQGGVAWTSSDTEVLSRRWQFMTGIGYRFSERWSVSVRHLSNASTGGRNRGENLFLLHYGF